MYMKRAYLDVIFIQNFVLLGQLFANTAEIHSQYTTHKIKNAIANGRYRDQ